jgi:hypothetical protein
MRKFLLMALTAGVAALCGCGSAPPLDEGPASAGGTALRLDTTPGGRGPALYTLF